MTGIHQLPVFTEFPPEFCGKRGYLHFLSNFTSALSESYRPRAILDLSMNSLMDRQAIEILSRCIEQIAARDGELSLIAPLPQTRLILELTRIDRIARVFDSAGEMKTGLGTAGLSLLGGVPGDLADKGGTTWPELFIA